MPTSVMAQNSIIQVYTCVLHFVVLTFSFLGSVLLQERLFYEVLFLDIFFEILSYLFNRSTYMFLMVIFVIHSHELHC